MNFRNELGDRFVDSKNDPVGVDQDGHRYWLLKVMYQHQVSYMYNVCVFVNILFLKSSFDHVHKLAKVDHKPHKALNIVHIG